MSKLRLTAVHRHDLVVDLVAPIGTIGLRPLTAATLGEWSATTPVGAESVLIDLSQVQFIDPMGLATVAAVAEDASACGLGVEFVAPQSFNVRNYIARMRLGDCLSRFCTNVDLPRVTERDTGDRLLELYRFDASNSDELAERVFRAILAAGGSEQHAISFFKGVSEVVNNAVEHGGADGGWAAMQVMPNYAGLVTFAVADIGNGLEFTLRRNNEVNGPVDAITKAFTRAVSGTGALGRGTGLDDLLQRVGRHQGQLRAWSSGATGVSTGGPIACWRVSTAFPGTVIYAGFKPI